MNTTRPSLEAPIENYLDTIATLDMRDGFVAPQRDVSKRLEYEIQRISLCTPANLATEHFAGETTCLERRFISAAPSTFAQATLAEIQRIAAALRHAHAKCFELAFHNTPTEPNDWSDSIVVAVRFAPKSA